MAIATEKLADTFFNIVAGTPIDCDWPLFAEDEIEVIYGFESLLATLNVDYTVALDGPNYDQFTVTPLNALLTKINNLIAADPTNETNYITVRRVLEFKTDVTQESVRRVTFLSRQVERLVMMSQQLNEAVKRSISYAPKVSGNAQPFIESSAPDTTLVWNGDGTQLVPGPTVPQIEAAEGYAEDAQASSLQAATYAANAAASATAAAASAAAAAASAAAAEAAANGWTTGDVKETYKTVADGGWVLLNDGTIGDAASGATTRANADTLNLFTHLWNNIGNASCPVSGGRGVSAAADFAAHKQISLPRRLGRSPIASGLGSGLTARLLGGYFGEEGHALTAAENGPHTHVITVDPHNHATTENNHSHNFPVGPTAGDGGSFQGFPYNAGGGGGTGTTNGAKTNLTINNTVATASAANSGSGDAHNNMQPSTGVNYMVKL